MEVALAYFYGMARLRVEICDRLKASTTQECQHHAVLYSLLTL